MKGGGLKTDRRGGEGGLCRQEAGGWDISCIVRGIGERDAWEGGEGERDVRVSGGGGRRWERAWILPLTA